MYCNNSFRLNNFSFIFRCKPCPVVKPIFLCGTDNRTYSSLCRLDYHNCIHHTNIRVGCKGFCPCSGMLLFLSILIFYLTDSRCVNAWTFCSHVVWLMFNVCSLIYILFIKKPCKWTEMSAKITLHFKMYILLLTSTIYQTLS